MQLETLTKRTNKNGIIYSINEKEMTAKIIGHSKLTKKLIISRLINYEFNGFIVIGISNNAFKNSHNFISIQFTPDSELYAIEKNAFAFSSIMHISIPASIVDLKDGWCKGTFKLTKIEVDPRNPRYSCLDGKFIIGKSDETQEKHDVLVFAVRNIKDAIIPTSIKIIGPYAFSDSSIKNILISSHVTQICEGAFFNCYKLRQIEFQPSSELQIIGKNAFSYSSIERIFIPHNVTQICKGAFSCCSKLFCVEIQYDSDLKIIDADAFSGSSIKAISIPNNVMYIYERAFYNCHKLQRVEIPTNSKLQTIGENAFSNSSIESITIPASVIELNEKWFCNSCNLKNIEVDSRNSRYSCFDGKCIIEKSDETKNELDVLVFAIRNIENCSIPSFIKIIGPYAFSYSSIEIISIPPHITHICEGAFYNCSHLRIIEIPVNSKLKSIGKNAFFGAPIERINIPSNLTELKEGWCNGTFNLNIIKIDPSNPRYSCLNEQFIIEKSDLSSDQYDILVFAARNITKAIIPSFIKVIGQYSFQYCKKLSQIEIPLDSELQTICKNAFSDSSIVNITIPPNVRNICKDAFYSCTRLQKIENLSSLQNFN